jgi:hypothetical protein
VRLDLPARMRAALDALAPGFREMRVVDFDSTTWRPQPGWEYPFDGRQALFAVLGDFDADGRNDVVVRQQSRTEVRTVVVLDAEPQPRTIEIGRGIRSPGESPGSEWIFLMVRPPGTLELPSWETADAETTLVLTHDAFEVVYWEKGSMMYYWMNGRFEEFVTAD